MAAMYNDGNMPYGSRVLYLSSSAGIGIGAYVAEAFEVSRPTITVKRSNELGEPSGCVYIQDWVTGTSTVQLPTTSSQIPAPGWNFSTLLTGSAESFIIHQTGHPESNNSDKKVSISFTKKLN